MALSLVEIVTNSDSGLITIEVEHTTVRWGTDSYLVELAGQLSPCARKCTGCGAPSQNGVENLVLETRAPHEDWLVEGVNRNLSLMDHTVDPVPTILRFVQHQLKKSWCPNCLPVAVGVDD